MNVEDEAKKITDKPLEQAMITNLAKAQYSLGYIAGSTEHQKNALYEGMTK